MSKQTNRRGFTITELVIVIVVIAILAAVLIPTFISLVNKANMSADEQAVRHMNTVLKAEEATDGIPANKTAVKNILKENGIKDFTPMMESNVFYWDSENNFIVLYSTAENKALAPKEYKDQALNADWQNLSTPDLVKMEDLGAATLEEALDKAQPGQAVVLDSDATLGSYELPKDVSIDLGGKTLTVDNIAVAENTESIISNGTIVTEGRIDVPTGANLTLDTVVFDGDDCAIFPCGGASTVTLKNSEITADVGICTTNNNLTVSNHVVINLVDTEIVAETGIWLNVPGEINITGGSITATNHCIFARAGVVNVKDTTLNFNPAGDFNGEYFSDEGDFLSTSNSNGSFTYGQKAQSWGTGSHAPSAPVVVGDFTDMYPHSASCTLDNVTVNCTNETYPDVFASQDVITTTKDGNAVTKHENDNGYTAGYKTEVTIKNCDLTWQVNTGKYTSADAPAEFGFYQHTDMTLCTLVVDNVYINGVKQEPGAKSN